MPRQPHRPDFRKFHKSISDELRAVQHRIRDLVGHAATSGAFKEAALRAVLRRHIPATVTVGRGFIVTAEKSSTEIDILIVDGSKPVLFRDGDLMIVTPDAVRAIIEVKSALRFPGRASRRASDSNPVLESPAEVVGKIVSAARLCRSVGAIGPWTGVFVFQNHRDRHTELLAAAGNAWTEHSIELNCLCCGPSTLVRYWEEGRRVSSPIRGAVWHSYDLTDLAPAYFVGNLVDAISSMEQHIASPAWFPIESGKETRRKFYLARGDLQPLAF